MIFVYYDFGNGVFNPTYVFDVSTGEYRGGVDAELEDAVGCGDYPAGTDDGTIAELVGVV